MVIELKSEQGIVLIWLTKSEADDPKTDAYVKALCPEYRAKGYLVAVMRSGSADLACEREKAAEDKQQYEQK